MEEGRVTGLDGVGRMGCRAHMETDWDSVSPVWGETGMGSGGRGWRFPGKGELSKPVG